MKPFIEWEKLPRSYRAWVNGNYLDVWPFTESDNLSIWTSYKWTVLGADGIYKASGTNSTLDEACDNAILSADMVQGDRPK